MIAYIVNQIESTNINVSRAALEVVVDVLSYVKPQGMLLIERGIAYRERGVL